MLQKSGKAERSGQAPGLFLSGTFALNKIPEFVVLVSVK